MKVYRNGALVFGLTAWGAPSDLEWVETVLWLALSPCEEGVQRPPDIERVDEDGPEVYTVRNRGLIVGRWKKA